ncbi:helix-turn-helix domain-containing protein [Vallitalea okinawensis]|uniref:helix-turn-helix domain-containing protein n=1 Tax=Vallitalea okinawensis TaxID=2078660 RepID=UPI00147840DA|nr:AraC family transcriptional regulator [Vallitalea okinawensis]
MKSTLKSWICNNLWTDEEINEASQKLTSLDLIFNLGNIHIDILWFRVMYREEKWKIDRHKHSSYEFHLVAQGASKVTTDEGVFVVKAGQFYVTPPETYHLQENLDDIYVEYCLNCSIEELEINASEEFNMVTILKNSKSEAYNDTKNIIGLFQSCLKESMDQEIGYYNAIKSTVIQILIKTTRTINEKYHLDREIHYSIPKKIRKNDERYKNIEVYIRDNISSIKSTKDIATHLYLSEKQICRIVREKRGMSTKELICKVRLERAKELLKETNYSIKNITDLLGFSSQYYFTEFFKKYESFSPSLYRRNIRKIL